MASHWQDSQRPETILKVRENQIRQLYDQSRIGLTGIILVAFGVCIILWQSVSHTGLLVWLAAFVAINIPRHARLIAFRKEHPSGQTILSWADNHARGSLFIATMWGLLLITAWPEGDPVRQLLVTICIASVSASAVSLYSSWKPSYLPYLLLPLPLCAIRMFLEPGLIFSVIGTLGGLFIVILFKSGNMMHAAGRNVLLSDIRNKELNATLLQEKTVQEELNARLAMEIKERKVSEAKRHQRNIELEQLNNDLTDAKASLETALTNVKQLSGLVPICAACKKIRNDEGYWEQLEAYIQDHSEAEFSHGICPECARKLYPEIYAKKHPDQDLDQR